MPPRCRPTPQSLSSARDRRGTRHNTIAAKTRVDLTRTTLVAGLRGRNARSGARSLRLGAYLSQVCFGDRSRLRALTEEAPAAKSIVRGGHSVSSHPSRMQQPARNFALLRVLW